MSQARRLPPSHSNQLLDGKAGKICRPDFKMPQVRQPAARNTSESFSSDGSSLAPSPSPSPQPGEILGKTGSPGKSFDSKGEDSDSGSFSAVVPESTSVSRHEKYEDEGEPAQWEDRHYRSPYLEAIVSRWKHDYATPVANPVVDVVRGRPHVAKDAMSEADFLSATEVVEYIMDRVPEEIRNGTPINKWCLTAKSSRPKRGRPRKNVISPSEPMPKCHRDRSPEKIESPAVQESPLFEEELKPTPIDERFDDELESELKPEIVNGKESVDLPGPSTSADDNGSLDAHQLLDENSPRVMYIIPAFALDKAPPRQEERDLLGVICALCDMNSINISKPNWFRLILNKCEMTLSQLASIENRRRLELETASELKNRLKNRLAVLNAKRRCLTAGGQSKFQGLPVRTGSTKTLAEGRGRIVGVFGNPNAQTTTRQEALSARGISLAPSDTNQMRSPAARTLQPPRIPPPMMKPVMYKRYRLKDGRVVTLPAHEPFASPRIQAPTSTAALVRPNTRPYFVVRPPQHHSMPQHHQQQKPIMMRRPEDGIPAAELLDEDEPPKPERLQPQGVTFVTAPRSLPTGSRPQVGFGIMRSAGRSPKPLPRPNQ